MTGKRYLGNIITSNPTEPTTSSASGVWSLSEARAYSSASSWPLPQAFVDYLIVAGGGGGGSRSGGGGAGGLIYSTSQGLTPGSSYTVTVGAGGTGGINTTNAQGGDGSDSSFNSETAVGGGGGGNTNSAGRSGGSGGGGGANLGAGSRS